MVTPPQWRSSSMCFSFAVALRVLACARYSSAISRSWSSQPCANRVFADVGGQRLEALEELAHLHHVVGEGLGGGVDRRQPAADHHHRQAQLHVGDRVFLGGAGELQRHQEVRSGAHAARQAVRNVEHGRLARADAQRDVVEAHRHGVLQRHRAAEAHAAEHGELAAAFEQQADDLEEVLVPAHGDAVFGDAAEAGHDALVERFADILDIFYRNKIQTQAARASGRRCRRPRGRRSSGGAPA